MWDQRFNVPAGQVIATRAVRALSILVTVIGLAAAFVAVGMQAIAAAYFAGVALGTAASLYLGALVADCAIYLARTAHRLHPPAAALEPQRAHERGSVADLDAALRGER